MCSSILHFLLLCVLSWLISIIPALTPVSLAVVYAVWKSSGVPAARSRISLQLSMDDLHETDSHLENNRRDDNQGKHVGRGWWDYVPRSESPASSARGLAFRFSLRDIFHSWRMSMRRLWTRSENLPECALARKSSLPGDAPLPQPTRPSAVRISGNDQRETAGPRSPMPSLSIYHSGLIPRMVLCREVMRDEVCSKLVSCRVCSHQQYIALLYYFYYRNVCRCDRPRCHWCQ